MSDHFFSFQPIGFLITPGKTKPLVAAEFSVESDSSRIHVKYILLRCFFFLLGKNTGVSFDTSLPNLISQISNAMMVFAHGAESFIENPQNSPDSLVPNLSCDSARDQAESQETRWTLGETFHK